MAYGLTGFLAWRRIVQVLGTHLGAAGGALCCGLRLKAFTLVLERHRQPRSRLGWLLLSKTGVWQAEKEARSLGRAKACFVVVPSQRHPSQHMSSSADGKLVLAGKRDERGARICRLPEVRRHLMVGGVGPQKSLSR